MRTPRQPSRRSKSALAAKGLALAILIGVLAACGGTTSSVSGDIKGTGKVMGDGQEIVYFGLTTQDQYIAEQTKAAKQEAERLGYKLKSVTNNFDAAQLQQQIQQQVASGDKPAAFILLALDQKAAVNQARQLSRIAPVFQINQTVAKEGFKYVKAYVGPDDVLIGRTAGENLMAIRDRLKTQGVKLHSSEGNLLGISASPGLQTTEERWRGLTEATKAEPFTILENQDCCTDAQGAYKSASQLIPKYKSKLDFVFVHSLSSSAGVIKALKENGLRPGKDVWVVTGNCGGPGALLKSGEVSATGAQLPYVEGGAIVQTIAKFLATGKVKAGTESIPYPAKKPAVTVEAPSQINLLSNPAMIGPDSVKKIAWGETYAQACPLS